MTVQALARQRFGFQRLPVVTAVVFVVTATTSVLGLMVPGMLEGWQRAPQGLHGDWWRTFTALLVQDGGVAGTISNLAFLLVLGAMAEQVLGPGRWLACYLGAGLVGELAGYVWQPRGAGNSVAICGLAGALTVALLEGRDNL
jgi:membrane associated rhomboid family serine protease